MQTRYDIVDMPSLQLNVSSTMIALAFRIPVYQMFVIVVQARNALEELTPAN